MSHELRIIAVTGGKGGTGKTCISANLGIALADKGYRVTVFDADLQLANLDVALGVRAPYNLEYVVNEQKTLREILCDGPGRIRIVTGGSAIPNLMSAGPKRMRTFISQIDDLAYDTDFLIFDTGAGLDNRILSFIGLAHEAIIVTTPDPSSVTDAYATIKLATKSAPTTELQVLVNMVSNPNEADGVRMALQNICQGYLGRTVPMLGFVHADHEVALATRKRRPFYLQAPHSRATREMKAIAATLAARMNPGLRLAA